MKEKKEIRKAFFIDKIAMNEEILLANNLRAIIEHNLRHLDEYNKEFPLVPKTLVYEVSTLSGPLSLRVIFDKLKAQLPYYASEQVARDAVNALNNQAYEPKHLKQQTNGTGYYNRYKQLEPLQRMVVPSSCRLVKKDIFEIDIENNTVKIVDDFNKRCEEFFTVFITNEAQLQFVEDMEKVSDDLNKLAEAVGGFSLDVLRHDEGKIILNRTEIARRYLNKLK
jgi:hypothetical protein